MKANKFIITIEQNVPESDAIVLANTLKKHSFITHVEPYELTSQLTESQREVERLEDKLERSEILLKAAKDACESYSKMFKILLNDMDVRDVITMLETNIHKAKTAIVVLQQHGLIALSNQPGDEKGEG